MMLSNINDLEDLAIGSIVRVNDLAALLLVRVPEGWLTYTSDAVVGPNDTLVVWEAIEAAGAVAAVVSVPGGTWISEEDWNYAAASAVYVNEITEMLIRKAAIQKAEFGFPGAPVYIEGHEILDLFVRVGTEYNVLAWLRGVFGKDYQSGGTEEV